MVRIKVLTMKEMKIIWIRQMICVILDIDSAFCFIPSRFLRAVASINRFVPRGMLGS